MAPAFFFKELTFQPKIFVDLFRFDYENVVCRKKNHQGSRFIIQSAKSYTQKVMKVPR